VSVGRAQLDVLEPGLLAVLDDPANPILHFSQIHNQGASFPVLFQK
jgi:hypothetical protein